MDALEQSWFTGGLQAIANKLAVTELWLEPLRVFFGKVYAVI